MPGGHRLVEVVGEAVAVAVDDAVVQALLHGQPAAVGLLGLRRLDVGEHLEQLLQRVVVGSPAVPHEVEADLALLVGQPVERHDLAGVDDRRVEPGLHGLVEEHAVEGVAGRRVEPEADVGHAERRVGAGDLGLDPADRLDRVDGVACAGRRRPSTAGTSARRRSGRSPTGRSARWRSRGCGGRSPSSTRRRGPGRARRSAGRSRPRRTRGPATSPGRSGCRAARRPRGWPS